MQISRSKFEHDILEVFGVCFKQIYTELLLFLSLLILSLAIVWINTKREGYEIR